MRVSAKSGWGTLSNIRLTCKTLDFVSSATHTEDERKNKINIMAFNNNVVKFLKESEANGNLSYTVRPCVQ